MAGPESNHRDENDPPLHAIGRSHDAEADAIQKLVLRPQEIPLDDPQSKYPFQPSLPSHSSRRRLQRFSREMIMACLHVLQRKAAYHIFTLEVLPPVLKALGLRSQRFPALRKVTAAIGTGVSRQPITLCDQKPTPK